MYWPQIWYLKGFWDEKTDFSLIFWQFSNFRELQRNVFSKVRQRRGRCGRRPHAASLVARSFQFSPKKLKYYFEEPTHNQSHSPKYGLTPSHILKYCRVCGMLILALFMPGLRHQPFFTAGLRNSIFQRDAILAIYTGPHTRCAPFDASKEMC